MIETLNKTSINCKVPEVFSLKDNTLETIDYFAKIRNYCTSKEINQIVFDLSELKQVTIDAIMYMMAMSIQINATIKGIKFAIKKPKHNKMRNFINNCGLKKFLKNDDEVCESTNDYYVIRLGIRTDTEIAKQISEFAKANNGCSNQKHISMLYKMLIEMMNNSLEHAYDNVEIDKVISILRSLWFVFIENADDRLKFTFLDTGIGIPNSLFKKKKGSIDDLEIIFGQANSESNNVEKSFVIQALKGKIIREDSNDANRGRGLPEIYGYYKNDNLLSNLCVISGNEKCRFYDSNRSKPLFNKLTNDLQGTLYYWEIKKDR